jgi:hypothetical protein
MKWVLNVLGILFILTGTIWILQGTGIFPVGGMAYQSQWTYIGIGLVIVSVVLFIIANRRRKLPPAP